MTNWQLEVFFLQNFHLQEGIDLVVAVKRVMNGEAEESLLQHHLSSLFNAPFFICTDSCKDMSEVVRYCNSCVMCYLNYLISLFNEGGLPWFYYSSLLNCNKMENASTFECLMSYLNNPILFDVLLLQLLHVICFLFGNNPISLDEWSSPRFDL